MTKYKKVLGTILAKVDQKFVIIKGREVFKINEVGARIFDLCNGSNSELDIIEKLSNFYNINEKLIIQDIECFIKGLLDMKLIKIVK